MFRSETQHLTVSHHRLPGSVKTEAIERILEKYRDFGPTLAHEYLTEQNGLTISVSSIRNIMAENKLGDGFFSKNKPG